MTRKKNIIHIRKISKIMVVDQQPTKQVNQKPTKQHSQKKKTPPNKSEGGLYVLHLFQHTGNQILATSSSKKFSLILNFFLNQINHSWLKSLHIMY